MRPVLKNTVIAGVVLSSLFGLGLGRARVACAEGGNEGFPFPARRAACRC